MNRSIALFVVLIAVVGLIVGVCVHDGGASQPSVEPKAIPSRHAPTTTASVETLVDVEAKPESGTTTRDVATEASATDSLVFEIVASDGTPVPDVRIILSRADLVLQEARVETGGVVSFPPQGKDVDVFVITSTALRLRHHLDDAVGRHVLQFKEGVTFRGSVLLDGAIPKKPIAVYFQARTEDSGLESLPLAVLRQSTLPQSRSGVRITAWSDVAGRFEIKDVPPTWTGTLGGPSAYLLEDARVLEINDLHKEVVLRLRERPAITGRVVKPGSSNGVPKAHGSFKMDVQEGTRHFERTGTFESEEDGSFRIGMELVVTRVTATIGACGIGRGSFDVRDFPATGFDVGDVVLQPMQDLAFVVHDRQGQPIEGALASTRDDLRIVSVRTGPDGRGALCAFPAISERLRFSARGFHSVTRDTQELNRNASLDVTMELLALLEIAVVERSGTPGSRLLVRLKYGEEDQPTLRDESGSGESELQLLRGMRGYDEKYALRYETDGSGRVQLAGLNPSTRFDISVEDLTGAKLFEGSIDPSYIGSNAPYRVVLGTDPSTLEVLVLDSERNPIRGATVSLDVRGMTATKTSSDGIAVLEPVYVDEVDLRVDMTGYVAQRLEHVPITHELEHREVVLTRGGSIRVRVVDQRGQSIRSDDIGAKLDGKRVGRVSRCDDDECFRIDDLPSGGLQLTATVAGQSFVKEHHSSDALATIEIPDYGSLLVEFSEPLAPSRTFVVALRPRREADGVVTGVGLYSRRIASESPTESLELPVVFPGRYLLTLQTIDAPAGQVVYGRVSEVEVRAGERTVASVPIMH